MDSVTQIALGAAVGEAVLGRKVGNKALLYGAIGGTIPDLDVLAGFFVDPVTAIEFHRSITHSLIFSLVAAPLLGWFISRIEASQSVSWRDWSWLMFFALVTHPLLDSFTTWGTQLFWPADYELAFKSIFVIDPLYTLPLLICLFKVIRQPRESVKRLKYNRIGLALSTGYLLLCLVFKGLALQEFQESLDEQGIEYLRMDTRPTPLNSILWTANVETADKYLIGYYSILGKEKITFQAYSKNHHMIGTFGDDKKVQQLITNTKGWYSFSTVDNRLYLNDLRFGKFSFNESQKDFVFRYRIYAKEGSIIVQEVEQDPKKGLAYLRSLLDKLI